MDYQQMIFTKALSINTPFYIKNIDFDQNKSELHIYVDFHKGSKFKCALCSNDGLDVHDTEEKTWRHLDFFQHKAFIHLRTPRTICPEHKIHFIDVPWGGVNSGFTLLIEAFILELVKHMPVLAVANILRETDTKIWRVINKHVNNARAIEDYSNVSNVGVDETSSKKGHNYVTLFVDMDEAKVIYATEGKDSTTVNRFKEDLKEHKGIPSNINNFSSDMSLAFIKGIKDNFDASITFDKFHVIKLVNTALDEVRRGEQKTNIELKCSRYVWLKNEENLNKLEKLKLENISKLNLKTARAYRLKLALQDLYNLSTNKTDAAIRLQAWYSWAIRSKIEPIISLARTIKNNWSGILNYFDSNLTNGLLEGINSSVQSLKARARGYKNINNFISMIYLIKGKLTFQLCKN